MLKSTEYETASPRFTGKVMYAVLESQCVFSGTTNPGSTINFAEGIIENIATLEGINPVEHEWLDLQTHLGYGSKKVGRFACDRLPFNISDGRICNIQWLPTCCPLEVFTLFKEYIGENPELVGETVAGHENPTLKMECESDIYPMMSLEDALGRGYDLHWQEKEGFTLPSEAHRFMLYLLDNGHKRLERGVIVDGIDHPNLIGQTGGRFSIWSKR